MSNQNPELSTELAGEPELIVLSRHLTVRREPVILPDGSAGLYTYVYDDYAAAATVPVDKRHGQRHIFMIRQERYPTQSIGWEIPAGGPQAEETQLQSAQRELLEEGGLLAEHWHQLPQQLENVGRGNSRSDIFVAAGITATTGVVDIQEAITDRGWFSVSDIEGMMLSGEINAGHTMAAIAVAQAFLNHNPNHVIAQLAG